MRGITREVSFPFFITPELPGSTNTMRAFKCQFSVRRSEYRLGTNYPPSFIGDEVKIKISALLVRPPE